MLQIRTNGSMHYAVADRTHPRAGAITTLEQAQDFRNANFGKDVIFISEDGNGFTAETISSGKEHCQYFGLKSFVLN